ncbi:MAG: hypothetical protein JF593_04815 [Novosphingobium sp.]|nr:hypothetical protein [Novosphingobium sp.]
MLARLPRPFAWLLLAALLLAIAWCLWVTPPPVRIAHSGGYTDFHLYRDVAAAVARGEPYHRAAAALHRAHHYPLKPFFTMRLPTLVEAAAWLGWPTLQAISVALLVANVFAWIVAFEDRLPLIERLAIGGAVAFGGSMVADSVLTALHEQWAGLLLSLALALRIRWPRSWPIAWLLAAAALAIRELALPFVLLAATAALLRREWREFAAWAALVALFAAFMALHAHAVAAVTQPGDLASQGWRTLAGPAAFLRAVVYTTPLQQLPLGWGRLLALLPALGWCALDWRSEARDARISQLYLAGYALMVTLFGRADTFYWGATIEPAYAVGYALLPRALAQLYDALRGAPAAQPLPA